MGSLADWAASTDTVMVMVTDPPAGTLKSPKMMMPRLPKRPPLLLLMVMQSRKSLLS